MKPPVEHRPCQAPALLAPAQIIFLDLIFEMWLSMTVDFLDIVANTASGDTYVLHKSARMGFFASYWKYGNVTPLSKSGSLSSVTSEYRPSQLFLFFLRFLGISQSYQNVLILLFCYVWSIARLFGVLQQTLIFDCWIGI